MSTYIPIEQLEIYILSRKISTFAWEIYTKLNFFQQQLQSKQQEIELKKLRDVELLAMLTQLLIELDGLHPLLDILVFGATTSML